MLTVFYYQFKGFALKNPLSLRAVALNNPAHFFEKKWTKNF